MSINRNMGVTEVRGLGVYLIAWSCGCRDVLCWCKDLVEREETMKACTDVDSEWGWPRR